MKRTLTALIVMVLALTCSARADEFAEKFALSPDRAELLKQLLPGSEDYYFYHCLHYQHTGQFDKVPPMLKQWTDRHGETPRSVVIRNRQALLTYEQQPARSLDYLIDRLGLQFNHQRQAPSQQADLPSRLDPELISRSALVDQALNQPGLNGFEPSALDWLAGQKWLTGPRLRELLSRLDRPDVPDLPALVAAELSDSASRGFGRLPIHRAMVQSQLDELLKLRPALLNDTNFVNVYLTKLQPRELEDFKTDPAAQKDYLQRLWQFVERLSPAFNSLKAHVLYHRLAFDRSQGVYDKDRFLAYLKLPRQVFYVEPKYLAETADRQSLVNLGQSFPGTLYPPIGQDEPLVRDYLAHWLVDVDDYRNTPFQPYLRDDYLKTVFAETKILNGRGDLEKWYAMLSGSQLSALRDRIDIDFAATNPQHFAPDQPVKLDVFVKNVDMLFVKVFQINTDNFYRDRLEEVDTSLNLDGLVANDEQVHKYTEPPTRRVKRSFEFPTITGRGVWVIEFIGNGRSSRALVRKGQLRAVETVTGAGHRFVVFNEARQRVDDATLWLAGHYYKAGKNGEILVPFSQPGEQKIVLSDGRFASLASFNQQGEQYSLSAGLHVQREQLLRRKKATLVIRPVLLINGQPTSIKLLEEPRLVIAATDTAGISSSRQIDSLDLQDGRETTVEFQTPENVLTLTFTLSGKVKKMGDASKVELADSQSFSLNQIDTTDKTQALHLLRLDSGYVLELLGKNGEALPGQAVNVSLKHRDFTRQVHVSLKTDAAGRVSLGELPGIVTLFAKGPAGTMFIWKPTPDLHSYPARVFAPAGQTVALPYMGRAEKVNPLEFSLLEVRNETYTADCLASARIKDGMLLIDDLPPGQYSLLFKATDGQPQSEVRLFVVDGKMQNGYLLGENLYARVVDPSPLQIVSVQADKDSLRITLANANKATRVHVAASRMRPAYPLFYDLLAPLPQASGETVQAPGSVYVTGRDIGEEYRYIIEQRFAKKFPGNMLDRPGLLLNPWALRSTETGAKQAAAGGLWGAESKGSGSRFFGSKAARPEKAPPDSAAFASLDFLGQQGVLLTNLEPDADGVIVIPRDRLGAHQDIEVLAADPASTVLRQISLAEQKMPFVDLRLAEPLDPAKHFAEQQQITSLQPGQTITLPDAAGSKLEVYDSLARVYGLYRTLGGDATLAEFDFVVRWPTLDDAKKRELYSKYACHELHLFLYEKDRAFFDRVIRPYLANKKDKTFLDRYLLDEDLSQYLDAWRYGRLNIAERTLLARRLAEQRPQIVRNVRELYELLPPDAQLQHRLFKTALQAGGLEPERLLGLSAVMSSAEPGQPQGRPAPPPAAAPPSSPARNASEGRRMAREQAAKATEEEKTDAAGLFADKDASSDDVNFATAEDLKKLREAVAAFYSPTGPVREWAENNYYHLPISQQNSELVPVNAFWNDYAQQLKGPFLSTHLPSPTRNFTEMMLALSVLDLPFEPGEHETAVADGAFRFKAAGPAVAFYREIKPAPLAERKLPLLVSQNFFRLDDRYRYENNERLDKYVTDEFLPGVAYGCQIVVTNPTSTRQRLNVLLQVPEGALPLQSGQLTRGEPVELDGFSTRTLENFFYFPATGKFRHYPVNVARNEQVVAAAEPMTFNVVAQLSTIDRGSWTWVSQNADNQDVLAFLRDNNVQRLDLERIAWRMSDPDFFRKTIRLLGELHAFNPTLWSYGLKHDDLSAARQYLLHRDDFLQNCGLYLDSKLVTIDPVARHYYQHLEYAPLINARAHQLGAERRILNDAFARQYQQFLALLAYRPTLDNQDLASATYYLLLQDRVADAIAQFDRLDVNNLADRPDERLATRLQYDYMRVYLDFYQADLKSARAVAGKYADYPVDRWRKLFATALAQLDEIEGKDVKVVDEQDRLQRQTQLAARQPSFDFTVEARKVTLNYQNLEQVRVNYYLMDVELLFSRNPFVQQFSGQFSFIQPNHSETIQLKADQSKTSFELPARYHSSNVIVEIVGDGNAKSQAYYANTLDVRLMENYGQLRVTSAKTGKPLAAVYVKVYAIDGRGQVRFYKDGYTDLRGRFDYSSLNTGQLSGVQRFSLLILSETDGATVREAAPPKLGEQSNGPF